MRPGVEIALAGFEDGFIENVGALVQFAGGLRDAALANVVAADDELAVAVEIELFEQRCGGDQAGGVAEIAAECGQAESRF